MDRREQKLREKLSRAKGGHKKRIEAQLAAIEPSPAVEVKAPAKKKKTTKKKSK